MVIARGAGCWARASGASTRTAGRTEKRKESSIRDDPLKGYECKKTNGEVYHRRSDGRREARIGKRRRGIRTTGIRVVRKHGWRERKIFSLRCIFPLHAETTLVFCECELALQQRRERVSLRRTRVKIEFFIASHPATFPRNPNSKKKSR